MDTGLTEDTRLTEIRQSGLFSNFNSTLHNLRVLKYKFEIVTIVQVDHILNFKKIALYMQYKLSSILFKKTLRQFGLFRQICLFRQSCPAVNPVLCTWNSVKRHYEIILEGSGTFH